MNLQNLLLKLRACQEAKEWADVQTIEQVVANCHRGDWLLWLAKKVDIDLQTLTLAKALCAKTVIHLMKDERSINAVLVAEKFGRGEATRDELNAAAAAADAYAADAAAAAAAAADAAADAYAAAYAAADAAADAAARTKNQLQTANICREIFGSKLIELVNNKLA